MSRFHKEDLIVVQLLIAATVITALIVNFG